MLQVGLPPRLEPRVVRMFIQHPSVGSPSPPQAFVEELPRIHAREDEAVEIVNVGTAQPPLCSYDSINGLVILNDRCAWRPYYFAIDRNALVPKWNMIFRALFRRRDLKREFDCRQTYIGGQSQSNIFRESISSYLQRLEGIFKTIHQGALMGGVHMVLHEKLAKRVKKRVKNSLWGILKSEQDVWAIIHYLQNKWTSNDLMK